MTRLIVALLAMLLMVFIPPPTLADSTWVVSTQPKSGEQCYPEGAGVNVGFSYGMDRPSTQAAFLIDPMMTGKFTWNPTSKSFGWTQDADLLMDTIYTVTIRGTAKNTVGTAMGADYSFSFRTEPYHWGDPIVPVYTSPKPNATGVPVGSSVLITLNQSINQSIATHKLRIEPFSDGAFAVADKNITFTPGRPFAYNTSYRVTLEDITPLCQQTPFSPYALIFTTEQTPPVPQPPRVFAVLPPNGAMNVPVNTSVTVTFDKAMEQASTIAAFKVTPVTPGSITFTTDRLQWTPDAPLIKGTTYTLTVEGSAKSATGIAMGSPSSWSFTTKAAPGPNPNGTGDSDHDDIWSSLPPPVAQFFRTWFLYIAVLALIVCLIAVAAITVWRRGQLEDVYLIYNDGRLIKHLSRRARPVDADVFSGMLTAVQSFVSDSIGEPGSLDEFRYGGQRFLLRRGSRVMLVAGYRGSDPDALQRAMDRCVAKIEIDGQGALDRWNGETTAVLETAGSTLERFAGGRY